jgi:hypothetical protein
VLHQPVDEFDGAVVTQLQALGQSADSCRTGPLESLDLKQHQVVLRLDPGRASRHLAHSQKAPDLVSQLRERHVVDLRSTSPGCTVPPIHGA